MLVYVQIVGVAGGDSIPSLLIVTDTRRYLVNVGEGMQRFCMEHRLRLAKVDGIFLTRVSTETCGGLPGMLLTLKDLGAGAAKLYGGAGLGMQVGRMAAGMTKVVSLGFVKSAGMRSTSSLTT